MPIGQLYFFLLLLSFYPLYFFLLLFLLSNFLFQLFLLPLNIRSLLQLKIVTPNIISPCIFWPGRYIRAIRIIFHPGWCIRWLTRIRIGFHPRRLIDYRFSSLALSFNSDWVFNPWRLTTSICIIFSPRRLIYRFSLCRRIVFHPRGLIARLACILVILNPRSFIHLLLRGYQWRRHSIGFILTCIFVCPRWGNWIGSWAIIFNPRRSVIIGFEKAIDRTIILSGYTITLSFVWGVPVLNWLLFIWFFQMFYCAMFEWFNNNVAESNMSFRVLKLRLTKGIWYIISLY